MRHASLGILAIFIGFTLGGCLKHPGSFHCSGDEACDPGRRCVDGACAKADSACESGYRWDDTAGERTGRCAVAPPVGDGGTDGGDSGLCGNGVVESGEKCDPGLGSTTPCPTDVKDCDDGEPCNDDVIIGSGCERECAHTYKADHTSCQRGGQGGICHKGACCMGCWNGTACVDGSLVGECGGGGGDCLDCQQGLDQCKSATCAQGSCGTQPMDGVACAGGVCHGGSCCTTCWNGTQCVAGSAASACGSGGAACADCGDVDCVGGACAGCVPQCTGDCGGDTCGGSCGTCPSNKFCNGSALCQCTGSTENTDALCGDGIDNDCNGKKDCADAACDGMRCAQTSGWFCKSNACIAGCRISLASGSNDAGGLIVAAGTSNPANPCQVCDPARDEQGWSSVPAGTGCKTNGSQGACTVMGMCCAGCIDELGRCRTGILLEVCGASGGACASCDDHNPCTQDSCDASACKHSAVADGTLCDSKCGSGSACDSIGGLSCGLGGGSCAITLATCKSGQCVTLSKPSAKCCSGSGSTCCVGPAGADCGSCK